MQLEAWSVPEVFDFWLSYGTWINKAFLPFTDFCVTCYTIAAPVSMWS
jgi:hypothetical protein